MTKNNEPQDELREALAELGSDKTLADGEELQAPLGQPGSGSSDNWAENNGSESVEEAFLALIQSNKADEGVEGEAPPQVTVPGVEAYGQPEEQPAIFSPDQSPLEENLAGNLQSNPFAQSPENMSPQNPFGNEPQVTTPEPAFTEQTQEEVLGVSETDERSLTEALSETIAQSLAEIHTSETIEEELVAQPVQNDPIMQSVAMQSEPLMQEPVVSQMHDVSQMQSQHQPQQMQPDMLFQEQPPVQPTQQVQVPSQAPPQPQMQSQQPSLPEFPGGNPQGANPLDNYPLDVPEQKPAQQVAPVEELIADMAAVTSSEIKLDSNTNNNDVMNQHHTYSNPFEAQKPQPAQVPPQVPVTQMGGTVGEASQAAKMSAPVPVELAGTGGNNKSNADPEFQALVQWSNSDVEPSHHGPHDMPNFLSQKREEESKFSIKTVFLSIGISVIVIGMFYVGYQAGSGQETNERVVDVTPREEEPVRNRRTAEATQMFENKQGSLATSRRAAAPVKPEATITVFKVASLKGQAGRTIPMNIRLEGTNLGQETMLLLRGIPNQISLTTGIKREGVWSVPISELRKLALNVPSNYKGNFDFEVFAFKDKESGPEHRLASVRIDAMPQQVIRREPVQPVRKPIQIEEPVRKAPPVVKQKPKPQPPVRTVKPKAPLINAAVEAAMLKRANSLLRNGDVAGARLVFEHVAVMGSKHAAFALARTYERPYLEQLNIIGVVHDINLAREWYKKAADLGHAEAAARLQQIGFAQ